jgi:hypothetical protein
LAAATGVEEGGTRRGGGGFGGSGESAVRFGNSGARGAKEAEVGVCARVSWVWAGSFKWGDGGMWVAWSRPVLGRDSVSWPVWIGLGSTREFAKSCWTGVRNSASATRPGIFAVSSAARAVD